MLRWRDLNNKEINVPQEWAMHPVSPGSHKKCPVANPDQTEILLVLQPQRRIREPGIPGGQRPGQEVRAGTNNCDPKSFKDHRSLAIYGWSGPDPIHVSAKSNLGPLCKYLCL